MTEPNGLLGPMARGAAATLAQPEAGVSEVKATLKAKDSDEIDGDERPRSQRRV